MIRIRYKDLLARNSHISYEDLVALVSDEASLDAAEKIRKHLGTCWHCQARHQELKQSIIEIVQNLNAYVGDLSSRSRIARCRLDQDLHRLAGEKNRPAPLTQVLGMLESTLPTRLPIRQIAIVAACLLALLAIFPLTSTAPISAAELLQRSKQAEERMMQGVPDPAIHGMFRVTKKNSGSMDEQSMTWEIWEDTVHNRVRNRVEGEQGTKTTGGQRPRSWPNTPRMPVLLPCWRTCKTCARRMVSTSRIPSHHKDSTIGAGPFAASVTKCLLRGWRQEIRGWAYELFPLSRPSKAAFSAPS